MASQFNWGSLIPRTIDEIPPDVIFEIVEGDVTHEVEAHRMVMGMVSIVFGKMFFTNTLEKLAKKILVKETTKPAFQIMVDAVYEKMSIEDSLNGKSVDEVFAVVNIVKRYEIPELLQATKQFLSTFPVNDDNVLEVASEAIEYSILFEKEAHDLLMACARYLKPKLKDVKSIFQYADENVDHKEVVATLLGIMNNIAPTECDNCKKEACQDGVGVQVNELRVGLIVTNGITGSGSYWGNTARGKGRVTNVDAGNVVRIEGIEGGRFRDTHTYYKTIPTGYGGAGNPSLVYCCK